MWDLGMISEEEYRSAVAEELNFTLGVDEEKPAVIYNWYDEQVITDVIQDLSAKYGYSDTLASNMVTSGGLKIYACADPDIQAVVEEVYTNRRTWCSPPIPDSRSSLPSSSLIPTETWWAWRAPWGRRRATGYGTLQAVPPGSPALPSSLCRSTLPPWRWG